MLLHRALPITILGYQIINNKKLFYCDDKNLYQVLDGKKFKEIYDTYNNILNTEKQIIAEKQFMKLLVGSVIKYSHKIMNLGEVCEFVPKKKKLQAKDGLNTGKYHFYTSSQNTIKYRKKKLHSLNSFNNFFKS